MNGYIIPLIYDYFIIFNANFYLLINLLYNFQHSTDFGDDFM